MLPWEDRSEGAGTPQIPKFPPVSPPVFMVTKISSLKYGAFIVSNDQSFAENIDHGGQ